MVKPRITGLPAELPLRGDKTALCFGTTEIMGTGTVQERMRLLAAAAVLAAAMLSPAACQVLAFALVPAAHNSIAPHSIFSALPQGPPSVAGNANIKDASLSRVGSRGRRTSRAAGVAAFDNDSSDSFGGKRQRFDMLQLSMSTSAVEVNEEGDAPATTSVEDEFDVKADLLNQIDLGTSSKKRCVSSCLLLLIVQYLRSSSLGSVVRVKY